MAEYDIGGGITAKRGLFGGIKAPALSKELLLQQLQTTAQPGRFDEEKKKAAGEAAAQIGAVTQGQQQDIAQQALAGGGQLAAVSGRAAELQRQLGQGAAEGQAQAQAATEKVYEDKGTAERQAALAALQAQQDRARQNAQFWSGKAFDTAAGLGEAAIGG